MEHFTSVQTWLINTYNIRVLSEWLSACLEWIAQESEGQSLQAETVKKQVFEQWLTSDLAEIGEPSLPVEAQTNEKFELISNYALQILAIVDAGFPLYGQQQKLIGRENVNETVSADKPFQPAWEPKASRMLVLTLTDGHSEIKAMECQPIKPLHNLLPSGTKCVLSGTVLCRRGMVLLTEEHIHLLGGEVDTLTEVNTPLAVLQKTMAKNKEDENKSARREFSGKFITRGSHKKLGWEQNRPAVKREGQGCSSQLIRQSGPGFSQVKRETKPVMSSMGRGKVEVKNEFSKNLHSRDPGNGTGQKVEDEWEDDINYAELLDDDMDFDEFEEAKPPGRAGIIAATHNTYLHSRTRESDGPSRGAHSVHRAPSLGALNRTVGAGSLNKTVGSSLGCKTENLYPDNSGCETRTLHPGDLDVGLFDDDDDLEMEAMLDDMEPSWQPGVPKLSNSHSRTPCVNSSNAVSVVSALHADSAMAPDLSVCKRVADSQNANSQDSMNISPDIPCQSEIVSDNVATSISCTSNARSVTNQAPQQKRKPLFKVEKHTSDQQQPISNTFNGAKKQKIQAKVSDLFRKCSKPLVDSTEKQALPCKDLQVPTTESLPAEPNDSFSAASAPSQVTEGKFLREGADAGTVEGQESHKVLPKAVIQPFNSGSFGDGPPGDKDSTFMNLSDLNSSSAASINVKVSIVTLIEKLCSNNGSHWSLACRVKDESMSLNVDISDAVLTELIGFSAEDSIVMRQRFKAEPQVKEVFAEGLSQCQNKLISGRAGCVIHLAPSSQNLKGTRPIITKLSHLPS